MKNFIKKYISSFLAGLCISLGCIVNLKVGGLLGPVLFTIGLLAVVHFKYMLYTGTAGFVTSKRDIIDLFTIILPANFTGCAATAALVYMSVPEIMDADKAICFQRSSVEWHSALIRGVFCGFLMTLAVKFARENKLVPLLFAVPVFILSGFYHSIADAFYICLANVNDYVNDYVNNYNNAQMYDTQIYTNWLMTVIGNFIGCNIYRLKHLNI